MTPGQLIRAEMEARGWTQRDLACVLGRPLAAVNEVIQGKRSISPEMAVALSGAFGVDATDWLTMDAKERISQIDTRVDEISKRAKLFELAPVKDMEKRGWLGKSGSTEELESRLLSFFETETIEQLPEVAASFKRTDEGEPVNPSQRAWCIRARQLARKLSAEPFDDKKLDKGLKKLRSLIGWPEEVRKVPRILADAGVRYVVIEPLPHTKIDGAAFWLDASSPVIAMSVRFDRIDNFWHVLGHELSHIRHRDEPVVDTEIVRDSTVPERNSPTEERANKESSAMWIDPAEIESFILRVGPLYSRARINQFANRLVVHPGLIVGQLHGRQQIGFSCLRDTLVKVREYVVREAMTDGWGCLIDL